MAFPSSRASGVIFNPYEAWKLERLPQPSLTMRDMLDGVDLLFEVSPAEGAL